MNRPNPGDHWERYAEQWLRRRGLLPLDRNVHCRFGEIDLILQQDQTVVFVEVRYRKGSAFGGACESVNAEKQQRIIRAAGWYLSRHPRLACAPCRFDVIGISGHRWRPRVQWLQDAFRLN